MRMGRPPRVWTRSRPLLLQSASPEPTELLDGVGWGGGGGGTYMPLCPLPGSAYATNLLISQSVSTQCKSDWQVTFCIPLQVTSLRDIVRSSVTTLDLFLGMRLPEARELEPLERRYPHLSWI